MHATLQALTDLATTGLDGDRTPVPGLHHVQFGVAEAAAFGMGYASETLTAV